MEASIPEYFVRVAVTMTFDLKKLFISSRKYVKAYRKIHGGTLYEIP